MSITPTDEILLVSLDFEGILSRLYQLINNLTCSFQVSIVLKDQPKRIPSLFFLIPQFRTLYVPLFYQVGGFRNPKLINSIPRFSSGIILRSQEISRGFFNPSNRHPPFLIQPPIQLYFVRLS